MARWRIRGDQKKTANWYTKGLISIDNQIYELPAGRYAVVSAYFLDKSQDVKFVEMFSNEEAAKGRINKNKYIREIGIASIGEHDFQEVLGSAWELFEEHPDTWAKFWIRMWGKPLEAKKKEQGDS